nr:hypothetical protein HmN_000014400 [Hymenolepis microstoma]
MTPTRPQSLGAVADGLTRHQVISQQPINLINMQGKPARVSGGQIEKTFSTFMLDRNWHSAETYDSPFPLVRLTIPLTRCAPMGIKPLISTMADGYGDQFIIDTVPRLAINAAFVIILRHKSSDL